MYLEHNDEFICGFDKDLHSIQNYSDDYVFIIARNKETQKFRYLLSDKINNFYLLYAYVFTSAYLHINNIDCSKTISFNNLNTIDSLVSDLTLEGLFAKLRFVTFALCKDTDINALHDNLFTVSLDTIAESIIHYN